MPLVKLNALTDDRYESIAAIASNEDGSDGGGVVIAYHKGSAAVFTPEGNAYCYTKLPADTEDWSWLTFAKNNYTWVLSSRASMEADGVGSEVSGKNKFLVKNKAIFPDVSFAEFLRMANKHLKV